MKPLADDLYRTFEQEVRTPAERLLIDAFLPPPETIPSAFAAPPASPVPEPAADDPFASAFGGAAQPVARDREEPEPPPKKRPVRRRTEKEKSLEEEIAEFMSRGSALAPDVDPEK